jgi:hypothetical protein
MNPFRDICLKGLDSGPEEAVNGRNVEEWIVTDITPNLADGDLGVGDASNLLRTFAKLRTASLSKMSKRLNY